VNFSGCVFIDLFGVLIYAPHLEIVLRSDALSAFADGATHRIKIKEGRSQLLRPLNTKSQMRILFLVN
jgi:hypothetical protein